MSVRDDILPEELTKPQKIVVERIMGDYLRDMKNLKESPYIEPPERARNPNPALDIDGLPNLINHILDVDQEERGIASNLRVRFMEDFPPRGLTTEIITYGLLERLPGSLSPGPPGQSTGRREWKPHTRGITDSEEEPGYKIIERAQKFDNTLVFTCWAKTNKAANKRARWFEDLMRDYRYFIKYNGIEEFIFLQQGPDIEMPLDGTENIVVGRPLHFFVRTERRTIVKEPTLRHLVIRYGIVSGED